MASINQNTPPPTLPDFCNLGVMLRVILIVNGLGVLAGFARNPTWPGWWQEFLPIAVFIQPGLLASLLLLCGLRQLFADRQYREFVAAVLFSSASLSRASLYDGSSRNAISRSALAPSRSADCSRARERP